MPFIGETNPLWSNLLQIVPHDIYHLPGYCAIEAWLLDGAACAWYHAAEGNQYLIPFIRRTVGNGHNYFDLVSPYGYPGMLSTKQLSTYEAAAVFSAFNQEAISEGFISSFMRLNPLTNNWKFDQHSNFRQWMHGGTVSVDLSQPLETIRNSFSINHKRNLSKLKNAGYQVVINDFDEINDFILAYYQTMTRRSANPYYFFPENYFSAIKKLLKGKLIYIAIKDVQQQFAAGGIFTHFGNIIQFHLGATKNLAMNMSPSKLMIDAAIIEGQSLGAEILHLGGGLGGSTSDGLFRFKNGFGNTCHPYSSLRFIHNEEVYNELKNKKLKIINSSAYFPEYR